MSAHPEPYLSFDRVADIYDATRHIPPECLRETARVIIADGGLPPGARFLDAGVGTGRFARHLLAEGLAVVGVDIATGMMRRAFAAAPELMLVKADLRRLPFAQGVFSGALIVHILHLIGDWQRAVEEIRRVLRPGAPLYAGCEGGKHFLSRAAYFQLAAERSLLRPHLGAASFDAVLEHLADTGAELLRVDGGRIQWTAKARVGEMLDVLRRNPYSSCWHIPAGDHADLMSETERRVREAFPSFDAIEETPAYFALWRTTWRD
jgi:ubiquinone/menaquinone biosynthesis C-methylase UbiE